LIRKILGLTSLLLLAACASRAQRDGAPPVPIPAPPPRHAEPPGFAGLSPDALSARLGAPAFSRKDGTTEMWRYDTSSCHAFFFLTAGQVAHVETIPRSGNDAVDPACLNALKKTP
jgi:hypothetical protein